MKSSSRKGPTQPHHEVLFNIDCVTVAATLAQLKATLSIPEWGHADRCPWCKRFKTQGHRDDCRGVHLRALLTQPETTGVLVTEWLS